MIYSTATVPVNPPEEPALTRDQLWKALVLKARDARLFLPPGVCTRCEVIAEGQDFIVRDANILGKDLKEIIAFEPCNKVSFFQQTGPREGVIVNQICDDEGGMLTLKFYCLLALRNHAPGSKEELAEKAQMDSEDKGYKSALLSTLARARGLVREGKL
jgi:hypothetical protein